MCCLLKTQKYVCFVDSGPLGDLWVEWENKGRSRSRTSRKSDTETKGHKGGKGGGDKGDKHDSTDKGAHKGGRSESEASGNTRVRSDPKNDIDSRRSGDWICICGDYKYARKPNCDCGMPNATRENRLAMWDSNTQQWDPLNFDESLIQPNRNWHTEGKGAARPQERPTLSSLPASSSGARWPPLEEAHTQRPAQLQRTPAEQPRDNQGGYGFLGNYADLQSKTIRARHK